MKVINDEVFNVIKVTINNSCLSVFLYGII